MLPEVIEENAVSGKEGYVYQDKKPVSKPAGIMLPW